MAHYGEMPAKLIMGFTGKEQYAFEENLGEITQLLRQSLLFDSQYYGLKNPDVAASGLDLLEHYARYGWKESRNPNLWFDSQFYIRDNPDIASKITNPLLHFACAGFREGRRANPEQTKRHKRLILVVMAEESSSMYDTLNFVRHIPDGSVDMIIAAMGQPAANDQFDNRIFFQLLATGAQIRTGRSAGEALLEIMSDYSDDALVISHPLAANMPQGIEVLRQSWLAHGTEISALQCAYGLFVDGQMRLAMQKPDKTPYFAIPLAPRGLLIPPGSAAGLLANSQYYLKYAPEYPSIWLAAQSLLSQKTVAICGGNAAGRRQPTLDKLGEPAFKTQLQDTLCCFRRELGKILGINILDNLFRKDLCDLYESWMHFKLDWENPRAYNEKLQRLKLCDDPELKTVASDKYNARNYIKAVVGEDYLAPMLGIWKSFEDIDFASLPAKFILKTTHGSGQNMIVNNDKNFDKAKASQKFRQWLEMKFYATGHEYNYFDVEPLIIGEAWLGDNLVDYKFYCFNGEPKYVSVTEDRFTDIKLTFLSQDWKKLDVEQYYKPNSRPLQKSINFDIMRELAKRLAKPFRHVRVDFYALPDNSVKVGELTFYHFSGFYAFKPASFDLEMGKLIQPDSLASRV